MHDEPVNPPLISTDYRGEIVEGLQGISWRDAVSFPKNRKRVREEKNHRAAVICLPEIGGNNISLRLFFYFKPHRACIQCGRSSLFP